MVHTPYRKAKGTQIEAAQVCLYIIMSSLDYVFRTHICTLHVSAVCVRTALVPRVANRTRSIPYHITTNMNSNTLWFMEGIAFLGGLRILCSVEIDGRGELLILLTSLNSGNFPDLAYCSTNVYKLRFSQLKSRA